MGSLGPGCQVSAEREGEGHRTPGKEWGARQLGEGAGKEAGEAGGQRGKWRGVEGGG